jgi:hypothetical protein
VALYITQKSFMNKRPDLLKVLLDLPLFDDLYLQMQAQNLAVVDLHIENLEGELLTVFYRTDSTPLPEMMFVSALSQMWVFSTYELLRTWRQRVRELLQFSTDIARLRGRAIVERLASEKAAIKSASHLPSMAVELRRRAIDWASSSRNRRRLAGALERVMPLFRRLEALRIALAKHEVAKTKGKKAHALVAFNPGYARIDPLDGSIKWMFDYADGTSDMLSRRQIADELRRLHRGGRTVGPAA